jgi:hypothetical protein
MPLSVLIELVLRHASDCAGETSRTFAGIDHHAPPTLFHRFGHGPNQVALHPQQHVLVGLWLDVLQDGRKSNGRRTFGIIPTYRHPVLDRQTTTAGKRRHIGQSQQALGQPIDLHGLGHLHDADLIGRSSQRKAASVTTLALNQTGAAHGMKNLRQIRKRRAGAGRDLPGQDEPILYLAKAAQRDNRVSGCLRQREHPGDSTISDGFQLDLTIGVVYK